MEEGNLGFVVVPFSVKAFVACHLNVSKALRDCQGCRRPRLHAEAGSKAEGTPILMLSDAVCGMNQKPSQTY